MTRFIDSTVEEFQFWLTQESAPRCEHLEQLLSDCPEKLHPLA